MQRFPEKGLSHSVPGALEFHSLAPQHDRHGGLVFWPSVNLFPHCVKKAWTGMQELPGGLRDPGGGDEMACPRRGSWAVTDRGADFPCPETMHCLRRKQQVSHRPSEGSLDTDNWLLPSPDPFAGSENPECWSLVGQDGFTRAKADKGVPREWS